MICGHRGFAGPTTSICCIRWKGHDGDHEYGVPPTPEQQTISELQATLLDVLTQACDAQSYPLGDQVYDTGALSAYRDGWELCVKLGVAERDGELVGRRGFYRPMWNALESDVPVMPDTELAAQFARDVVRELRELANRLADSIPKEAT